MNSYLRFGLTSVLIIGTALFLRGRTEQEIHPDRLPLAAFPIALGPWTGSNLSISPETREILGNGDFLSRWYRDPSSQLPGIDLFMAYYPSQQAGDTAHSPKHCLPGSGWLPEESGTITVSLPGHAPFKANRYVIAKGADRQLVIYWFLAHDRAVASEYAAKFYLIADSLRLNRSDGSLIRITTPLAIGETAATAQPRLLSFAGNIVPLIDQYVPR